MLIPIIKVKCADGTFEHIVGTNSHDTLFVDEETGGIHYQSLQNCETTQKVLDGKRYDDYAYEFVGETNEYEPYPQIEFVTIEEFFDIVKNEIESSTEREIQLNEIMKDILEKKKLSNQKKEESRKKTGITIIS